MPLYGRAGGDYREWPDRASFDVAEIVVSCWVRFSSVAAGQRVVCRGLLDANGEWSMGISAGSLLFFAVRIAGANVLAGTATLPAVGEWVHLIGTYQSADGFARLYVGNVLAASTAGSGVMPAATTAVRLFEVTNSVIHGDCSVAGLGIWGALLDASERQALAGGMPPHMIRPESLVLADMLEADSTDVVGMVRGTDAGNVMATPQDAPRQLRQPLSYRQAYRDLSLRGKVISAAARPWLWLPSAHRSGRVA